MFYILKKYYTILLMLLMMIHVRYLPVTFRVPYNPIGK